MKRLIGSLFFVALILNKCYSQDVFSFVGTNIANQLLSGESDSFLLKTAVSYLPQLKADGSWPDIDYGDSSITNWGPGLHLQRVKRLALLYIKPGNLYSKQDDLYKAVVKALGYWYSQDPKSSNWWHNEIATPQILGEIMIIMHQSVTGLPLSLEDSLVGRMKRGNVFKKTGANKLDIAIHYLYRACITSDGKLMDTAVSQAFQPIQFTTEEGLQYDFSYLQHGRQLQIASYGQVFLLGEYKVASWVSGTRYALSGDKLAMLDHYLSRIFLSSVRGTYSDFNIEGRGISRPGILNKREIANSRESSSLLELAKASGVQDKSLIEAAIERINQTKPASYYISPEHRHFWRADYTQQLRPGYSFNVRMVSDRTKRTEAGNRENLLGKFLPDGSTNIQRGGGEYYNIMPVWEWDKIPGITCRDSDEDRPIVVQWGEMGSTSFVGGVSDGKYGASAYDMDYDSVKAKKAWFFFDKEVVSLGAGISSRGAENLVTTVNQCWLNGKVFADKAGKTGVVKKDRRSSDFNWVWHDSIGYFFPRKEVISISSGTQKGSWNSINGNCSAEEVSGKVFKMWTNHGAQPSGGQYALITVPGISRDQMKSYNSDEIVILSNTSSVQAVSHTGLKIIQIVFYQPGTVDAGDIEVSVDKPCIVLIKKQPGNMSVSIADPAQKEKIIRMLIKSSIKDKEKKLAGNLPEGHLAGSSAQFNIDW